MILTTSSMSSVHRTSLRSASEMRPCATIGSRIQSSSPCQYAEPINTTGKDVTFPVCTSVSASNSSSMVPKPPGSTTNAWAYLMNIVLRAKKYRKDTPTSTHSLSRCSNGCLLYTSDAADEED